MPNWCTWDNASDRNVFVCKKQPYDQYGHTV